MRDKRIPMIENRKPSLPTVYGDTPSFLGTSVLDLDRLPRGYDVIFAGVPWEGTVTWGSFSSCELAPRTVRHASARYGGFLPEYQLDIFDHLRMGDVGDISVVPTRSQKTMDNVFKMAQAIYQAGSIPFTIGGDHSFSPEIVRALGERGKGRVGIVHFDAHLDNSESFGPDRYPRCGPIYRMSKLDSVRTQSVVHIGIRGPRNSKAQYEYAKTMGSTIYNNLQIRELGIERVIDEAVAIAKRDTERFYVTICSDCVDIASNAGGPIDFDGLQPWELFSSLFRLGQEGLSGLDFVEIYPLSDPRSISSHLAAWAMIHALAGLAKNKLLSKKSAKTKGR